MSVAHSVTEIQASLEAVGVVGVLRGDDPQEAVALAEKAIEAGLKSVEVTFTIPEAGQVISSLRSKYPSLLLGAGSVMKAEEVEIAVASGVQFLVSPHLSEGVLSRAFELGVLYVPGALTPGEVHRAAMLGRGMVKIFPISRMGGAEYVRDLLGPYPHLKLMVTGGIALSDVSVYRRAGASVVGLGSVFATPKDELRVALDSIPPLLK
jgi:2-dehydro-3-deoxyphosphogluconate aldolase/(4S)-4-hydroxy-2-oxoglutarate aldolase